MIRMPKKALHESMTDLGFNTHFLACRRGIQSISSCVQEIGNVFKIFCLVLLLEVVIPEKNIYIFDIGIPCERQESQGWFKHVILMV